MSVPGNLDLSSLRRAYASGSVTPADVVEEVLRRADDARYPNVWITKNGRDRLLELARAMPP